MVASEAHIQGIARFLVGFGTEEDDKWRDYHFDFCGTIDYDPRTGDPIRVNPVENSGYSLGCRNWTSGKPPPPPSHSSPRFRVGMQRRPAAWDWPAPLTSPSMP